MLDEFAHSNSTDAKWVPYLNLGPHTVNWQSIMPIPWGVIHGRPQLFVIALLKIGIVDFPWSLMDTLGMQL